MRRSVLRCWARLCGAIAIAQVAAAQLVDQIGDQVRHGVPVVGVDVGAAIPISGAREIIDPGGAIAPFVGYQIGIGQTFTFTPILQPQYAAFSGCCSAATSITSVTAGARFSLNDERSEIYFGAQGGYYWNTQGPRDKDDGPGFNVEGGYNYDFWRGTGLGLFIAYHEANLRAFEGATDSDTEFLVTGIELRHRFLPPPPPPPPPVVAAPVPPPATGQEEDRAARRELRFRQIQHPADAVPILDEAARTLKEYGDVSVSVEGHTDSIGTDAYNQALSERRANAVKDYLERQAWRPTA